MTNSSDFDLPDYDENELSLAQKALRWVQIAVAFFLMVYLLGMTTGATVAMLENETISSRSVLVSLGSLIACLACGWWLWRLKPLKTSDEPVSPRTRKARQYMWASLTFGIIIGLVLVISALSVGGVEDIFGNGRLPATPAIVVAIAYVLFLPIAGWLHLRSIDEHEAKANYEGALAGIYTYSTITPAWWLLARGGVVPPVEAMIVFALVMLVWGTVWLVRREL